MRTLTPDLAAALKSTFQAGASGFRSRVEIDLIEFAGAPSCVAENGVAYPLTAEGTYAAIGLTHVGGWQVSTSTDVIQYGSQPTDSGTDSDYPTAGLTGHWSDTSGVAGSLAGTDYTTGNVNHWVKITVVGPGTLDFVVNDGSGGPNPGGGGGTISTSIIATAYPTIVSSIAIATSGNLIGGGSLVIPDTGACAYHVFVLGNHQWGFTSVTWTPLVPLEEVELSTTTIRPKSVSIDKSLRMTADQADIELPNEGLPLGWGPDSLFPTNSRFRVFQWYGDEANAVQTFTGLIDEVHDHRDVLTTTIRARDLMAILIDQTFSTSGPQGADEADTVRTEDNGVYLDREVSYIVRDILTRAGWPAADLDIAPTSYVLTEFVVRDGASWAETIIGAGQLTGYVGYSAWADEAGVFHFRPTLISQSFTDPGEPAYTFRSGEDITSLDDATDQYDLRTRVKVRGPLTTRTLSDVWRELWRTTKFTYPVGLWFDPSDAANLRVLDRGTKRLYTVRQSDRAILSSVDLGGVCPHPLGLSGDPSDAGVYWVLNAPWKTTGSTAGNTLKRIRKSDNHVLTVFSLPNGRWSAVKVSAAFIWLTNLDTDRFYKRSKTTGAAIADYSHTWDSTVQVSPTGLMVNGTTLHIFWSNYGDTARFLVCEEAAPATVLRAVVTTGTSLHGGEFDTVTDTECYGDSDDLHLVAKFTLIDATDLTPEVSTEVIDTELEDDLGQSAQLAHRIHDAHSGDAAHPFEVRRLTLDLPAITSIAQATETAQRQLDLAAQRKRVVDAGIIGNPAIGKTDLVAVLDPVTGISSTFAVDTYRSSMDAAGTYLGTVALLHVADIPDEPTEEPPAENDPDIEVPPAPTTGGGSFRLLLALTQNDA